MTRPRLRRTARDIAALGAFVAVSSFGALLVPSFAHAQDTTFSLDRLRLGGAPDDGVGVWRPEIAEKPRLYGQFNLAFALNPFRVEHHVQDDAQASEVNNVSGAPVQTQLNGYATIGIEALGRLGFQVMFPFTFVQTGNSTAVAGVPSATDAVDLAVAAPGDLRFEGRGVIVKTNDDLFKLAANANIFAPSGNDQSFTGEKSAAGGFGVAGELDFKDIQLVLDTGVHFRPTAAVNDFEVGHEWNWGFGAFIPLRDDSIRLGGEIFGSVQLTESGAFEVENLPLEWMAEARFAPLEDRQLYFGGHGGTRLVPGYAPDMRIGAFVGYWFNIVDTDPKSPKKVKFDQYGDNVDTDKDGYPDNIDLCPTEPEDGKPPYTTDGCPALADRDGDGIPDIRDKCPDEPEDYDKIDDFDGCPEDDADKDGIPDGKDACPKEPGDANPVAEKNGCPQFIRRITGTNEIQVLKKIEFEFGSSRISPASYPILDEVVRLLVANPEITLMSVEGHTDNVGSDELNMRLSKERAKSAMDYLVQKGIERGRLTSEGFGESRPLDSPKSNDTAEGRAKNRRTEFHIKKQSTPGGAGGGGGGGPKQPEGPIPGQ
jgi:outer membrane protein OmpA-like peptidoglycan-associated protein